MLSPSSWCFPCLAQLGTSAEVTQLSFRMRLVKIYDFLRVENKQALPPHSERLKFWNLVRPLPWQPAGILAIPVKSHGSFCSLRLIDAGSSVPCALSMVHPTRLPKPVLARCPSHALIWDATSPGYRNKIGFSLQLLLQVKLGHWTTESRGYPWDLLSKMGLGGGGGWVQEQREKVCHQHGSLQKFAGGLGVSSSEVLDCLLP